MSNTKTGNDVCLAPRFVVSFLEVRAHLNITSDDENDILQAKTDAAIEWVSRWLDMHLRDMATVPADLKQAVLMLTGHWYEHREGTLVGGTFEDVPFGVRDIIDNSPHRKWGF